MDGAAQIADIWPFRCSVKRTRAGEGIRPMSHPSIMLESALNREAVHTMSEPVVPTMRRTLAKGACDQSIQSAHCSRITDDKSALPRSMPGTELIAAGIAHVAQTGFLPA